VATHLNPTLLHKFFQGFMRSLSRIFQDPNMGSLIVYNDLVRIILSGIKFFSASRLHKITRLVGFKYHMNPASLRFIISTLHYIYILKFIFLKYHYIIFHYKETCWSMWEAIIHHKKNILLILVISYFDLQDTSHFNLSNTSY